MTNPPLPLKVRVLALALMSLGVIVSWASWQNAVEAFSVERLSVTPLPDTPFWTGAEGEKAQAALELMKSAHLSAVESMRWPRLVVLAALCLTSLVAGLSAMRVRWPLFGTRTDAARVACWSAFASTILRALEGAQQLAIAKRTAPALAKAVAMVSPQSTDSAFDVQTFAIGSSVLQTVLVVAGFTFAWRAFGAPSLQAVLARNDERDDET